jgi:hypothetical protein
MRSTWLALAVAGAALAGGCGSDGSDNDNGDGARSAAAPQRALSPDTPPERITCADLADKVGSAKASREASFTLADRALKRNPRLAEKSNRNQLAQRVFVGMIELCQRNDRSYVPAAAAVKGVEAGKYQLAPPEEKYVGE